MQRFYGTLAEPAELVIVDGADHLFDGHVSEIADTIADFLSDSRVKSVTMPEAVIVAAVRTPVGKAPNGALRHTRPDDLAAAAITAALAGCRRSTPPRSRTSSSAAPCRRPSRA